jgi:uncharacterized protein YidB (DUF937 family)
MGLLDGLLNSMMSGTAGGGSMTSEQSPLLQMALQILQQNGGIEGVLAKFQQAGYGAQAGSWVSTGQNVPISGDVLSQVLGNGQLDQIAQQLGMSQGAGTGGLASVLPQVIDHMTPQGQVPADHDDIVAQTLALLQQKRSA